AAADRIEHYRVRCLQCHETHVPCSKPEPERRRTSKADSCIDCHMPRYASADIAHTASTDHRIVRRQDAASLGPIGGLKGEPTFVSFYPINPRRGDSLEDERDLGIALAQILVPQATAQQVPRDRLGRRGIRMLEKAIESDPSDIKALEARAELQAMLGRYDDALES